MIAQVLKALANDKLLEHIADLMLEAWNRDNGVIPLLRQRLA